MGRATDDDAEVTTVRSEPPLDSRTVGHASARAVEDRETARGISARAPTDLATREALELAPGQVIGRYELVSRLGAGAMGVVWSARDPQLDRLVAIKLVHPDLARSPDASSRLLREARAMAKLSHRAVVTVFDAGEVDDVLFLAMELVEGTTLGALLRDRPAKSQGDWRRWLRMMIAAGRGLAAAHRSGVLHRDFKPDNVLVDNEGRVCVGDFGLATLGEAALAAASMSSAATNLDLTMTGALLGTPVYMSPQQLRGQVIDARADQFSFCVALHEALYGMRPFAVTNQGFDAIVALADEIELGRMPEPARSPVPTALRDVVRRGLAGDPAARWPDMDTLLAELERAAKPRRGPWLAGAAVAAIAVIAVIAVIASRGSETPRADGPRPTTAPMTAKRMFELPIRATIAISPDGKYLAIGSDRVEVRSFAGSQMWSAALGSQDEVGHIEFDGGDIRFGHRSGVRRWKYAKGGEIVDEIPVHGRWIGRTSLGDLFYNTVGSKEFSLVADGAVTTRWTIASEATVFAISPDGSRLAYLEAVDRFRGSIVVRDLVRGVAIGALPLVDPTSLAWLDNATVLYATGSIDLPTIHRLAVGPDALGASSDVYSLDAGVFGGLATGAGKVLAIAMRPTSRSRIVENSGNVIDLDTAAAAAVLAWMGNDDLLVWSRSAKRLERQTASDSTPIGIPLVNEPANATVAGETLIVSLRRAGGRDTVAYSLVNGALLWRHPSGTHAARCAGDLRAPCFAIHSEAGRDRVVTLDPATGELGTQVIFNEGTIEDIAVHPDGTRLLVVGQALVYELEAKEMGKQLATYRSELRVMRSVAYAPDGSILVGGTKRANTYQVGRITGTTYTRLVQSENDILLFVRPDPTGTRTSFVARVYAPEVLLLEPPR